MRRDFYPQLCGCGNGSLFCIQTGFSMPAEKGIVVIWVYPGHRGLFHAGREKKVWRFPVWEVIWCFSCRQGGGCLQRRPRQNRRFVCVKNMSVRQIRLLHPGNFRGFCSLSLFPAWAMQFVKEPAFQTTKSGFRYMGCLSGAAMPGPCLSRIFAWLFLCTFFSAQAAFLGRKFGFAAKANDDCAGSAASALTYSV